ncbi:hypothetical protein DFP72DRAFT_1171835 [Ephemerocybe angulata]|uniref:C2H2-type domain-containing protein n=1 Tax=Ephemerocybe angulata TaxID=980116 RepID=A0A8H6M1G8_9AGAR|nr:hypothetical protein DFP72DRAFT_1171835 [Tulosesus angulatus]
MHLNIITLLPLFAALASSVNGYYADEFDARDYVDGLSTREINQELRRREIVAELADFSTRDLLDAISIQLERRGGIKCSTCNREFKTHGLLIMHECDTKRRR